MRINAVNVFAQMVRNYTEARGEWPNNTHVAIVERDPLCGGCVTEEGKAI